MGVYSRNASHGLLRVARNAADVPRRWHEGLCVVVGAMFVSSFFSFTFYFFIRGIANSQERAATCVSLIFLHSNINGFLRPVDSLPHGLRWYAKRNVMYYMIDAAMSAQFGKTLRCGDNGNSIVACPVKSTEFLDESFSFGRSTSQTLFRKASTVNVILFLLGCLVATYRMYPRSMPVLQRWRASRAAQRASRSQLQRMKSEKSTDNIIFPM